MMWEVDEDVYKRQEDLYSPDFVEAYQKDEDARRIIDTALSIEGLTRGCLLYTSRCV